MIEVDMGRAMQRREFMRLALAGAIGTMSLRPRAVKAQTSLDCKMTNEAKMPKRIVADQSCGIIVDVQESFLLQLDGRERSKIIGRTWHFARLLDHFKIPIVVTLERPVDEKGSLPQGIKQGLGSATETFEKNFFDLSREKQIRDHLAGLKKKQVIIAGAETDVCVLESCLGLLSLGYEVFVVENLLFSSSRNVDSAIGRMKAEGATFLTYKSLFYALSGAVETQKAVETSGSVSKNLPELDDASPAPTP
jgi:nicotinamidase-related amidase